MGKSLVPASSTSGQSLGREDRPWDKIYARSASFDIIGVTPTDWTTVTGHLLVRGNAEVRGNFNFSGSMAFGDSPTDQISFIADVNSDILPDSDLLYSLGSNQKKWGKVWAGNVVTGQISAPPTYDLILSASNDVEFTAGDDIRMTTVDDMIVGVGDNYIVSVVGDLSTNANIITTSTTGSHTIKVNTTFDTWNEGFRINRYNAYGAA